MTAVLYTTINSIRSTIGLDADDVSDQMILDQNLDLQMLERLTEILPTYETIYDDSEAGERKLTLWCQYFGALQLINDTVLGIPQKIQANSDQLSRFAIDFEKLKAGLMTKLSNIEGSLIPTRASASFSIMGKSAAGYDPITGT